MPALESKTVRNTLRTVADAARGRLAGARNAVAGLAAEIMRGLAPAPVLQPIPVRVRRQRRP